MRRRTFIQIQDKIHSILAFIAGSKNDSRERRIARYVFLFLLVIIANILLGKNVGNTRYPWYANVSIFLLLNVNIILVLVIFIVLFRNVSKLMEDRRLKLFGARMQTKLVIFSVVLVVVPVSVTYIVSVE
ncbi:MAG: hypothetical protein LBV09_08160, partial [Deferribacteraceae bacterium]|nr:hypothetical protein [Deferribacteraceae bacterium]